MKLARDINVSVDDDALLVKLFCDDCGHGGTLAFRSFGATTRWALSAANRRENRSGWAVFVMTSIVFFLAKTCCGNRSEIVPPAFTVAS